MNVDLHYSQHFQDTAPSFTLVTKQLSQDCVQSVFLGFVAETRETILNGFILDQFLWWLHVSNVLWGKKEGKIGILVVSLGFDT